MTYPDTVGELVEELVAAVGDRSSEVGAVHQLEGQDRRGMSGMQLLQLGHCRTLARSRTQSTWVFVSGRQSEAPTSRGRPARRTSCR